jgi:hypothetical protein
VKAVVRFAGTALIFGEIAFALIANDAAQSRCRAIGIGDRALPLALSLLVDR